MRPRLLDLFCGAGGAAMGYHRAGFEVVGVDIKPQPNYPFTFAQADALEFLAEYLSIRRGAYDQFDAIHASPPCQAYSRALRHMSAPQPELIAPTRELLNQTGLPWVIENVIGAPLVNHSTLDGRHGVEVCGTMFGLRIGWHRLFESNIPLHDTGWKCLCDDILVMNPHNQAGRDRIYAEYGRGDPEKVWRKHRDTAWMGRYEAREAVPPAYTEFIGAQLLAHLKVAA